MNQLDDPFIYEVNHGETITIKVTPTGVGAFVAASLDGHTFAPLAGTAATAPTFVFTANRPVGKTHICMMEFSFPGAPKTAKYDVAISSDGGGKGGFTVKATSAIKDPIIRFRVTA
ncbi:MAG TPA: hypothetical protein VF525_02730 [Pyrinomonadaceae bacterium]|jgi:hypothetical protein